MGEGHNKLPALSELFHGPLRYRLHQTPDKPLLINPDWVHTFFKMGAIGDLAAMLLPDQNTPPLAPYLLNPAEVTAPTLGEVARLCGHAAERFEDAVRQDNQRLKRRMVRADKKTPAPKKAKIAEKKTEGKEKSEKKEKKPKIAEKKTEGTEKSEKNIDLKN